MDELSLKLYLLLWAPKKRISACSACATSDLPWLGSEGANGAAALDSRMQGTAK